MRSRSWLLMIASAVLLVSLALGQGMKPDAKPRSAASAVRPTHSVVMPEQLKWQDLGHGFQFAVVSGDPSKAGPFVLRIRGNGAAVPPHWHPSDEYLTVLQGTFLVGDGDKFDEKALHAVPAGGYVLVPKLMHHFAKHQGDTIVQVHGMGPFVVNYVNPADDPKNLAPKK